MSKYVELYARVVLLVVVVALTLVYVPPLVSMPNNEAVMAGFAALFTAPIIAGILTASIINKIKQLRKEKKK